LTPSRSAKVKCGPFRSTSEIKYDGLQIEDAYMFRRLSTIGKTMIDPELTVLHTGRRAHQLGWPRLIFMRERSQGHC